MDELLDGRWEGGEKDDIMPTPPSSQRRTGLRNSFPFVSHEAGEWEGWKQTVRAAGLVLRLLA